MYVNNLLQNGKILFYILFILYMKLTNLSFNNLNFKSGLTKEILADENNLCAKSVELELMNTYATEACFLENKSFALVNKLCINIFKTLATKLNIPFEFPPAIYLYKKERLIDSESSANFCIPDTKEVLKDDYPFAGRSLFFREFENLAEIDDKTELQHRNNINSTSHFLSPFIHEWLHSFQLDYIFKQFGYGGECEYLKEMYPQKQSKITGIMLLDMLKTKALSCQENKIVGETLGIYSTLPSNQYLEIFSESFTKFICESLKNGVLIRNPLEQLKNTPKEFQNIFTKVCLFK